jgi:hypothetical protein
VDPVVANVTYARPYLVNLQTSITDGKLTLLAGSNTVGVNGTLTNLGNLSPAAGGSTSFEDNLGALSPSAGGSIAGGPSGVNCGNAYLDHKWLDDPQLRQCTEKGQPAGPLAALGIPDLSPSAGGNLTKQVCVKYATHKKHHVLAADARAIKQPLRHHPIALSNAPKKDPCIEYATVPVTSTTVKNLAAATPVTTTK